MFDSPAHGDASMPRREGVGFVLERVSPTRIVARIPPRREQKLERKEKVTPPQTYFCASSKFSTSSGMDSGLHHLGRLAMRRRGGLILGVVVRTLTSRHA